MPLFFSKVSFELRHQGMNTDLKLLKPCSWLSLNVENVILLHFRVKWTYLLSDLWPHFHVVYFNVIEIIAYFGSR